MSDGEDDEDAEKVSRDDVVRILDSQVRIELEIEHLNDTQVQVKQELVSMAKDLRFITNILKTSVPQPRHTLMQHHEAYEAEPLDTVREEGDDDDEDDDDEAPRRAVDRGSRRSAVNRSSVSSVDSKASSASRFASPPRIIKRSVHSDTSEDRCVRVRSRVTVEASTSRSRTIRQRDSTSSTNSEGMALQSAVARTNSRWAQRGTMAHTLRGVLALPQTWPTNIGIREALRAERQSRVLDGSIEELVDAAEAFHQRNISNNILHSLPSRFSASLAHLQEKKTERWVMSPSSDLRLVLDVMSMVVLLFDLATTPYILAWDLDVEGAFLGFTCLSLMFWTSDIFTNFRLGFYKNGELEMRPMQIARRYLRSTFILDITVVVVEWFGLTLHFIGVGDGAGGAGIRVLRIVKVSRALRVLNVLRMARVAEIFDRLSDRNLLSPAGTAAIEVIKILLFIVWLNHLICCLWYAIGRSGDSDTGAHWLDIPGNTINHVLFKRSSKLYQYFTAFHWSLTQMTPGSMKVEPQNSYERMFNICCLLFGLLCFSTLVSLLSSKMMHVTVMKQDQNQKIGQLRRFLRQSGVSQSLSMSLTKQSISIMNGPKMLTVKDIYCLNLLPESRQSELYYELYKVQLTSHAFFRFWAAADMTSLRHLCFKIIESKVLQQEDNLFLAGFKAVGAFVLMRGRMRYYQFPHSSRVPEPTTEEVEPGAWLSEACLWTYWTHVGTAEATCQCEVLFIDADEFVKSVTEQHLVKHFALEYADNYHARVVNAVPPHAPWPNDLGCPFTDYGEIVVAMSHRMRTIIGMLAIEIMIKRRWFWSRHSIVKLQEEVRSGTTTFLPAVNGEILRVVVSTTALITRVSDDFLFVQLGAVKGHQIEARCKLPSTALQQGELPSTAWNRIMSGELQFMAGACSLDHTENTLEVVDSDSFGLRTMYVRINHYTELVDEDDMDLPPHVVTTQAPAHSFEGFTPPAHRVLVDRLSGLCYTWLPRWEFEHLSNHGGREVEMWLRSIVNADGGMKIMSVHGKEEKRLSSHTGAPPHIGGDMHTLEVGKFPTLKDEEEEEDAGPGAEPAVGKAPAQQSPKDREEEEGDYDDLSISSDLQRMYEI